MVGWVGVACGVSSYVFFTCFLLGCGKGKNSETVVKTQLFWGVHFIFDKKKNFGFVGRLQNSKETIEKFELIRRPLIQMSAILRIKETFPQDS